jgi:hypothetical protein
MKTIFLSIIIVLILAPLIFNSADAELDKSLREPFENNDLVIIGKVIHVNSMISENKTEYNIQVEEYLKGQKPFDMITAILDDVRPADFPNYPMDFPNSNPLDYYNKPFFEEENQVFAYLKQDGGTFKMSPYSFTIKKKSVAGPPTVIIPTGPQGHFISQGDEIIISGVIKKGYLYELGKNEIDSSFHISILNEKEKQVESEELSLSPDGSYKFAFQSKDEFRIPGNYSWGITYWNGGMGGEFVIVPDFDRWSPLKQIKSGVALVDVQCSEEKQPVYKYDRMRVACVSEETQSELWNRGWATMRFYTEENTSSHALCNNYEGKWHPENGGCRDITDYQCSLMGGEFVHDVGIYSAGTYSPKIVSICVTMDAYVDENFVFYRLLMPGDSLAVNSSNPDFIEIPYKIENGKLKQMKNDANASSLIMDIDSEYGGNLTMVIPFGIIDKMPEDAHLSIMVLANGEEIDYQISEYRSGARSIYVEFVQSNPKIEIIGAWW